ncbi:xylose isomerase [Acrocarpospora corrugata]|uniref:Xylose isomerase n=1 Tax=Acrocarpospora corrugata TaxID=35763 RepID=A0A5M3VUI9_9ACTN|nr:sugar phosphate isomerase/epimerase family protein [Acrocarpospora corrugata]GER98400.1 xylose isomerase [Acrocarpospora corrugata]
MRLAVSTLGLPGEDLAAAIETAARFGCEGLELRLHPDTGVFAGLDAGERVAVREAIRGRGLEVAAVAGYIRIAEAGPDEVVIAGLRADLELAADLGASGVRVFPGGTDAEAAGRRILAVAGLCRERGVRVLVETHDALPTGAAVGRLLDVVDLGDVTGAIWDVVHPWRHGETPADTCAALNGHLSYVQIKDAVSSTDTTPRPLWAGSVPLDTCGELLRGFGGWVSLEWERTWYPDVEPVDQVLPGAREWVSRYAIKSA